MSVIAGIDSGSISVKIAIVDDDGRIVDTVYQRHHGRPLGCLGPLLHDLKREHPGAATSFTGSTGRLMAEALECPHLNELSAFALATHRLLPEVRTIFEMGGEDSKLILLGEDGSIGDFSLNSVCAAGTGSFLDQQAERMGLSIEEFARAALESKNPPRIAGRCSVFAKSDMIHLQQIATPLEDIVAGLCFAVARNFRGSIVRGRSLAQPAAFMGGVSLNRGVVRAFREIFEMPDLVIHEQRTHMGSLGAALSALRDGTARLPDPERLENAIAARRGGRSARKPLIAPGDSFAERHRDDHAEPALHVKPDDSEPLETYMGVDIGSISTNLALVDREGNLLAKRYLRTASRPIEAVRRGLAEIEAELIERGISTDIRGVGTTGSGRYMIADFIGADVVKNEITAQATAATFIDSEVDTIFEIGGQDSKFISLRDGVIVDFEMNKACAAGTGSFLEEQAEKLSVPIREEFARRALAAEAPCRLGERCTVFMENSLMSGLQQGARKNDLLAGLAYSIVENYIGRVVDGRPIGERIFFQGGTAFNDSVTAAFEKYLGQEITVPPNHDVTGAIGMALIARDTALGDPNKASSFRGFALARRDYRIDSFACKGCDNLCEINKVRIEGEKTPLFYGGRCEKWDIRRRKTSDCEDLFAFREAALTRAHDEREQDFRAAGKPAPRGVLGLPRVFFFHDFLPYFSTLLWELGFEVRLSPPTDPRITQLGSRTVLADTCYPIKAAMGHALHLLRSDVRTLFLPSFVNVNPEGDEYTTGLGCPLTQSFPYQLRPVRPDARILAPLVDLRYGNRFLEKELATALADFGVNRRELRRAMRAASDAQARFRQTISDKGREVLDHLRGRAMVIIGRPYNAFDPGMNLDIPAKLATLNEQAIPMDFLPDTSIKRDWPHMYWRSGQRILRAARFVRRHPNLAPIFIGNFSCGPDSFILKYFDRELSGHPTLTIEIDEHSADAGVVTRLEAFLDSMDGRGHAEEAPASRTRATPFSGPSFSDPTVRHMDVSGEARDRTIYIPRMCDHALGLAAAFRSAGVEARVMERTDDEAMERARQYVSGKECYPCAVTTADMLRAVSAPDFDPERSAFFMPSGTGPCRFGQYNIFHRMALDKAGHTEVPVFSPEQSERLYREMGVVGSRIDRRAWESVVAIDLLTKCLHETRPLCPDPAEPKALYDEHLERICEVVADPEGDTRAVLREVRRDFEALPRTVEERPLIGIVGEIFVRSNPFSNEDLVLGVESLGGRAWLAPIDEWLFYVGAMARRRSLLGRNFADLIRLLIKDRVQRRIAHHFEGVFEGFLETVPEIGVDEVLEKAAPFLPSSFEGEAVLSVGKAVDMCEKGVCGIINAMPFGCMPGTVSSTILTGVCRDFGVPFITLPFDGSQSPTLGLTLESFMEQARRRMLRTAS